MKDSLRLLPGVLLAGLLVLGGCGKKEEEPTRFNRVLGGTSAGVPVGTVRANTGIARDPSAYKPADYQPLEGAARGPAAAGGPEVAAIQGVLRNAMVATFDLDIESALDACVPGQVALLSEDPYMTTLFDTKSTLVQFWAVTKRKAAGTEFEPLVTIIELLPELAEPIADAMTVTVLDDENAVATFNLEQLRVPEDVQAQFMAEGQRLRPLMMMGAMMAQMAAASETAGPARPGAPPPVPPDRNVAATTPGAPGMPGMGAGGFSPEMFQQMMAGGDAPPGMSGVTELVTALRSWPLRKTGGEWKLVLPFSIQEQHARLIDEGLLLVKDLFAQLTTEIDKVETLSFASLQESVGPVAERFEPAFKNWWGRVEALIAEMRAAGATEETEQEAATEPSAPQDPNAAQPREPGPGRGRAP